MTNIGNSPPRTPYPGTSAGQAPTSDKGKGQAIEPAPKTPSPAPTSSFMHVNDSEHVESSRRHGPPEVVQPATYNYRSLDRQVGPRESQIGVTVRGGKTLFRQENSESSTSKSRAGKFSEKARMQASSSLSTRDAHPEAEGESFEQSGSAASAFNVNSEHLSLNKEELNRIRAERKGIKKAVKDARGYLKKDFIKMHAQARLTKP